jgi:predicted neutral ceramidase superfamily lipid hydrolase
MRTDEKRWTRVALYSAAGMGAGMGFFGLFSDLLERWGDAGDRVGHLVGLPIAFAVFVAAMAAALRPARRTVLSWLVATAVLSTIAYLAGFALAGPPVDFAASILVAGLVLGVVQRRALRRRSAAGAGRCLASAVVGYTVGAVAGVASAIAIAPHIPDSPLWYALLTAILGAVAGAVGGALNGYALTRFWWASRVPASPVATW